MVAVAEIQPEVDQPLVALWAPGSAVLAMGEDADGNDAVAAWQISPAGQPTGAWVVRSEDAFSDPAVARRLLVAIERRALATADPAVLDDVVARLTVTGKIDADRWWSAQRFSPTDAFGDVLDRRAAFDKAIASVRQTGRTVAPLRWARAFAKVRPTTVAGLQEVAAIGVATGSPVIAEALRLSRLMGWLVGVWTQTEQVKNRRDYVREQHGEPEALPPSWLTAVTTASATRLPL